MYIDFIKTYLNKTKALSIIVIVFFITSFFAGYFLAHTYPEKTKELIYDSLKNVLEPAKAYSSFQLFAYIFFKNLTVAILTIFLGIIFGVIPVLIIMINGLILGVVSFIILEQFDMLVLLSGIIPHGIIEIPAFILSTASGLLLWRSIWQRLLYDKGELDKEFISIISFFVLVITPMIAIAALIETFITPHILDITAKLASFPRIPLL